MKTGKKLAALLLAVVLVMSLSGCGAFETKMARAWQKLDKLDSLRLDVEDDLSVSVAVGEQRVPIPLKLSGTVDLYLNPVQAKADLVLTWPGKETKLTAYLQEDGETMNVYWNLNGGVLWEKASLTASHPRLKPNGIKYIIECVETFREVEQPGVTDGSSRFDGQLPGSFIQGFLEIYEVENRLADDFGLEVPEGLFASLNSVPASLWINRDGELDLIVLEPAAFLNGFLPRLFADYRAASGLDQLPLTYTVENNRIILQLSHFDELEMLVIPEKVLSPWGDGAADWE
ncbi:MAG: hypothetical protein Q4E38_04505 [Eubacteriales bacterium]|nr:hypothetical protein [Eubacteriales bacterium]